MVTSAPHDVAAAEHETEIVPVAGSTDAAVSLPTTSGPGQVPPTAAFIIWEISVTQVRLPAAAMTI